MLKPAELLLVAVVAIGVFSLALGALIAGGGVAAVRRQWRQLALLAVGIAAVALTASVLDQQTRRVLGIVVLGCSLCCSQPARFSVATSRKKPRRADEP